ncbi:hypothetical protein [Brevibacillus sp. NRS-1366]|uniref:hypothetical protein n=1 Tax=Brevibacillus sp. NRS-1366 TaxID=3233899 RepID=UPI003D25FF65
MITFSSLEDAVSQLDDNLQICGAYRKSAYSDIQFLKLIVSGNSLTCTDESTSVFDQQHIGNIKDIKGYMNQRKKCNDPNGEMIVTVRLNNHYMTGFKVNNFILGDGMLILDLCY